MTHHVIKPDPGDEDVYLIWSTNSDNWIFAGTFAEILGELEFHPEDHGRDDPLERMRRAQETGTSALFPKRKATPTNYGGFAANGFIVHNLQTFKGWRYLRRHMVGPYARAILDDNLPAAEAFTEHDPDGDVPWEPEVQQVEPTGAERYLAGRLTEPEYRKAYEDAAAALAVA